ncbi:hypothetical protein AtEden1_Chr2g0236541 [Arabidopsis thaliana]
MNSMKDQKTKALESLEAGRCDRRQLLHRIRETRSERENAETETSIAVSKQILRCSSSPGKKNEFASDYLNMIPSVTGVIAVV